jgi:hypothetical protein
MRGWLLAAIVLSAASASAQEGTRRFFPLLVQDQREREMTALDEQASRAFRRGDMDEYRRVTAEMDRLSEEARQEQLLDRGSSISPARLVLIEVRAVGLSWTPLEWALILKRSRPRGRPETFHHGPGDILLPKRAPSAPRW